MKPMIAGNIAVTRGSRTAICTSPSPPGKATPTYLRRTVVSCVLKRKGFEKAVRTPLVRTRNGADSLRSAIGKPTCARSLEATTTPSRETTFTSSMSRCSATSFIRSSG